MLPSNNAGKRIGPPQIDVYDHLNHGEFSVQIGEQNPFGRIPVDQTIEDTVNKNTQTAGGTRGFSLKSGAVARYYLTSEYRSQYLKQLSNMIGPHDSDFSHPDLHLPRIRKDEANIQSVNQVMETSWLNPFSPDQGELVQKIGEEALKLSSKNACKWQHQLLNFMINSWKHSLM